LLIFSNIPSKQNGSRNHFSRINQNIEIHPSLASNEYNAGEENYGAKANRDLIVTRGDGFRKEKQKKKKGSYRGGVIDFQTRSFKFD
jgi:SRP40, C-terminal domain